MTMDKLPIQMPTLDDADRAAVLEPMADGWLVQGPRVAAFEQAVADEVDLPHGAATTSCTTALTLCLQAWGIGPGDEVVVPAFTFIASANAVEALGAKPVFCDVDPATFVVNLEIMEAAITPRTRVLMPVSLFGFPCPERGVRALADARGLKVLEDAACSLGTREEGRQIGTLADACAFSFHPRKVITTGEGGMLLTRDAQLDADVRRLREHGAGRTDLSRHLEEGGSLLPDYAVTGMNGRMTDLQGALGLSQMAKLDTILKGRRRVASWYAERLRDLPWLILPEPPPGCAMNWQSYVTVISPGEKRFADWKEIPALNIRRNRLMAALEGEGIAVRQGTHAVHDLAVYRERYGLKPENCPNAFLLDRLSMALPLFPAMTERDVDRAADALTRLWG